MGKNSKIKKKYNYLWLLVITAFLWSVQVAPSIVLAGSINSDEQRIIDAAEATYEYEGKQYRLNSQALAALEAKLSSDDVDLTAGDADFYLAVAFGNIAEGVADGYLVEITSSAPSKAPTQAPTKPTKTPTGTPQLPGEGSAGPTLVPTEGALKPTVIPAAGETKPSTVPTVEPSKTPSALPTQAPISKPDQTIDPLDQESTSKGDNSTDTSVDDPKLGSGQEDLPTMQEHTEDGQASTDDGSNELEGNHEEIKNTGFSLQTTIIIGCVILALLLVCLGMAYPVRECAHDEE